jgi:hypothetical protein
MPAFKQADGKRSPLNGLTFTIGVVVPKEAVVANRPHRRGALIGGAFAHCICPLLVGFTIRAFGARCHNRAFVLAIL